jgi:cytochrome c biogenesis protein ResB
VIGRVAESRRKKCTAYGEIYTVRYEAMNAMLLNEFLKEHRKVEEQGAITAKQQKQIEALTATLQKVSRSPSANLHPS